ncbi:37075_t:CDS:2 [Racocetra persica]|uniref:37075_t:CDS:1 n=1 Tax=Racocetra persica TaxID=160502 RepID=A0ACA9MP68_9GLOM|nr:37075_t:CDS:2 [Racocetra persica]
MSFSLVFILLIASTIASPLGRANKRQSPGGTTQNSTTLTNSENLPTGMKTPVIAFNSLTTKTTKITSITTLTSTPTIISTTTPKTTSITTPKITSTTNTANPQTTPKITSTTNTANPRTTQKITSTANTANSITNTANPRTTPKITSTINTANPRTTVTTSSFPANGKLPVVATSDLKVTTVPLTSNLPGPQSAAPTIQKVPTSNASPTSVSGAPPTSVSGASPTSVSGSSPTSVSRASPTSVSGASPTSAPIKSNNAPTQKPNSSKSSITKTVFSTVATFVPGYTSAVMTTDSNGDVTVVNAFVPPTTIVAVNSVVTAVPADDQNSMAFSSANISSSFWGMGLSLVIGFMSFLLVA